MRIENQTLFHQLPPSEQLATIMRIRSSRLIYKKPSMDIDLLSVEEKKTVKRVSSKQKKSTLALNKEQAQAILRKLKEMGIA